MMAIDTKLGKMNPLAYENTRRTIDGIHTKIAHYNDQKTTIHRLAIITITSLVVLLVKVAWEWLVGTELSPTSLSLFSIIFGIYNLCIGLVTLVYWIDGKRKAKTIEEEIKQLVNKSTRHFYGEIVEVGKDSETQAEVLTHIQKILKSCFEKPVHIEIGYRLIVTYEIKIEGETPETFKYSSDKINDNFDEVQSTIGIWRKCYSELLQAKPETPPAILKVVATQCVQDLPELQIEDDASLYSCTSPLSEKLHNRNISRKLRGTPKQPISYQTVGQFREYLVEMPGIIQTYLEELPKVNIPVPLDTSKSGSDKITVARRKSSGTITVIDDYVNHPATTHSGADSH